MNISIAMASYNGEKYIEEQVSSIVSQLKQNDEVIVSDDGSTDETIKILEKLARKYSQIKLIEGPHKGVFKNFENAMMHCKNEIIFLSDQDDVWIDGKVEKIKKIFNNYDQVNVVLHQAYVLNYEKKTETTMVSYHKGFWGNLIKSSYWGCCMAVRKCYIEQYLPFKGHGTAHDQLIGIFAERDKCVHFEETPLCYHRFHASNQTFKRPILKRISFRFRLLQDFLECVF